MPFYACDNGVVCQTPFGPLPLPGFSLATLNRAVGENAVNNYAERRMAETQVPVRADRSVVFLAVATRTYLLVFCFTERIELLRPLRAQSGTGEFWSEGGSM